MARVLGSRLAAIFGAPPAASLLEEQRPRCESTQPPPPPEQPCCGCPSAAAALGRPGVAPWHLPRCPADTDTHARAVQALEAALRSLEGRWNCRQGDPRVGVVRLAGWAHADDRTAFKEMARQLCE